MHLGKIRATGTPAELRASLNSKRLEVHAEDLGKIENALSEAPRDVISDVQRFGDRLDVMTRDPGRGRQYIEDALGKARLTATEIRENDPTLENTFVEALRAEGQELKAPEFPGRHPHTDLRDDIAIGASNLSKRFGSFVAVNKVNIQVRYGEIYGLLGANGAGKTTTIKMLCGLLDTTSGEMELAGERGSVRTQEVRQRIGYMSQKFSLYDDLTIDENLDFFAGVYGVPEREREEKKKWVMAFAGLEGKENVLTGSLPGGWKQRVAFGAAIMHEPPVLFLDEPTSGVDPLARRAFWRLINKLADMGTAILVTTHYLEEAEQCNRLGFMVAGELVAEGTPGGVKAEQGGHLIEFHVDQPQRAADFLKEGTERWRVSLFGDRLHVITEDAVEREIQSVTEKLTTQGIKVLSATEEHYSLEDVFIVLVEKARGQGKVGEA
jgi:ABC-2 type transport system ATP-binding protein